MKLKVIILSMALVAVTQGTYAQELTAPVQTNQQAASKIETESVASLKRQIAAKETKKRKIDKENPCVQYADEDNPGMNVKKTMDRRNGRYPRGLTLINRTFFCPIHKGGDCGYGLCKKGRVAMSQWNSLKAKVAKTNECDKKVELLLEEIETLRERLKTAEEQEREAAKQKRSQK